MGNGSNAPIDRNPVLRYAKKSTHFGDMNAVVTSAYPEMDIDLAKTLSFSDRH